MADKHPYAQGTGALIQFLDQLRKSFPATVNADLLKKLGLAPKNESYIINVVRFLKLIDEEGKRTMDAQKLFTTHEDEPFQANLSKLIESAYSELFQIHAADTWSLAEEKLISFFRQTDQSSELVGKRQAATFRAIAAYAGHGETLSAPKARPAKRAERTPAKASKSGQGSAAEKQEPATPGHTKGTPANVGLTVRIEVNLPSTGDQETYDRIFKSIRENLING
jgi:hypothetical protein